MCGKKSFLQRSNDSRCERLYIIFGNYRVKEMELHVLSVYYAQFISL